MLYNVKDAGRLIDLEYPTLRLWLQKGMLPDAFHMVSSKQDRVLLQYKDLVILKVIASIYKDVGITRIATLVDMSHQVQKVVAQAGSIVDFTIGTAVPCKISIDISAVHTYIDEQLKNKPQKNKYRSRNSF